MRRRATLVGTMAMALVVIAFGATAYTLHGGQLWPFSRGVPSTVTVVCPGPTYTISGVPLGVSIGVPLIQPRNDCTPSFTEQDVREYLMSHATPFGRIQVVGKSTITAIVFTTIRDLGRASGDSEFEANYPADMVVCYVALSGMMRPLGGPLIPGKEHTTAFDQPRMGTAFFMLDAHTGNILVEGGPAPV